MTEVKKALRTLIQGETDAVNFYMEFSKVAKQEGFQNISTLFKALAKAEEIHIKNHYNALGEEFVVKKTGVIPTQSTLKNINFALSGERKESKKLYPKLIKSIKKYLNTEFGKVAKLSMTWAKSAEKEHAKLLKMALKSLSKGCDMTYDKITVCTVCGNVIIDQTSDKECIVCGHDSIFFQSVDKVVL